MTGQYYVQVADIPEETYGPYGLRAAQDFARIGSQFGSDRLVVKEGLGGRWQRVRRYSEGRRTWPTTRAQARRLKGDEVPGAMRRNPEDAYQDLVHSIADAALFDTIASVVEYAIEDGLVDPDNRVEVMNYIHGRGYSHDQLEEAAVLLDETLAVSDHPSAESLVKGLGAEDTEEMGYYIYMQAAGHGVAWTDSHDEELYTPDWSGHGFAAFLDSEEALGEWLS